MCIDTSRSCDPPGAVRSGCDIPPTGYVADPWDTFGQVVLGLHNVGLLPPGPIRDPSAAILACRDLLRALGVTPVEPADVLAETRRAVRAVAAVTAGGVR